MVLLTDGKSKDLTATVDAVKKADDLNIRTYAVSIDFDINQEELLMTSNGDPIPPFRNWLEFGPNQ